ncbi:hypothetical protein HPP_0620 [Hydrangea phyllody phytoplasma]|uniref:Uncharacterized protein n=2 Tax=16SrI (Aster yellows group) TaxID=3042590 RepID=A0ABQ5PS12_9MOLU|nr:hypothetical protein [Hydrangea phyllody phytoplasma]GFZ75104.1 hypothetical protein HPP_0620 [Hydrangea phyllody phytoplasma]GLH61222.1 hypothetical protein RHYP_1670 [Rhus yellows phytoplasma]GLH61890.1 hypothetical protein HP2P_2970 [Hydrangea phyllody phytoplasma]
MIFNFFPFTYAHSYFHYRTKSTIKLADTETLKQEWLTFQPKMKRYDISVLSKESIPEILKYFDAKASICRIKEPPVGLLEVYLKPTLTNPFDIRYPSFDNKYTLEDLLKYEYDIEEIFVFWDATQTRQKEHVNIEVKKIDIFADQNKVEVLEKYLIEEKIIQKQKLIKLGCYNITPDTDLVAPLPSDDWNGLKIEAMYFDDGIRILPINPKHQRGQNLNNPQTYTIEDLLKLSNGAKNVYLFTFNTQKKVINIKLPDSLKPHDAILQWKRDNNLYNYEGTSKLMEETSDQSTWVSATGCQKKIETFCKDKTLKHTFETETKIYYIICTNLEPLRKINKDYQGKYVDWLTQCCIRAGECYSKTNIINKFGSSDRYIYDEKGRSCQYIYSSSWGFSSCKVNGYTCTWYNNVFTSFYNTTPPPTKPEELE